MAYVVNITSRAERDLAHLYRKINAEYSDLALKWYRGLKEAILSLEEQPNRCPVTRKSDKLRHLFYGHKLQLNGQRPGVECTSFHWHIGDPLYARWGHSRRAEKQIP
jgi:plasmid stabilization system protein ParE